MRRGGRERRTAGGIRQLPFSRLVNPYSPIEILSADQVDTIIDGALKVLEGRGFRFLEPASRETLLKAGAERIDDVGTMRLDRGLVMDKLALAPRAFTLRARNRERDLAIGGRNLVFTSVGGPASLAFDGPPETGSPPPGSVLATAVAGISVCGLGG